MFSKRLYPRLNSVNTGKIKTWILVCLEMFSEKLKLVNQFKITLLSSVLCDQDWFRRIVYTVVTVMVQKSRCYC